MSFKTLLLPPVIDQKIDPTPLTALPALGFAALVVGAGYLAARRNAWALALLVAAVPFAAYRDLAATTVTTEKAVLLGVVAGLALSGAMRAGVPAPARRILLAGLLVLLAITLSSVHAAYRMPVLRETLKQVEYLALFWTAMSLMLLARDAVGKFQIAVVVSVLVVCASAFVQSIVGGAPSGIWINNHIVPRVAGVLEGPNQLAGYLEVGLPLLWLSPMLCLPRWTKLRFVAVMLGMAVLVLTQSRTGIGFAFLGYAALWLIDRPAARVALWPVLAGAVAGSIIVAAWYVVSAHAGSLGMKSMFEDAVRQNPGSVGTRGQLWPAAVALFRRSALTGVGAGNYELLLSTVGLHGIRTHANSLWLQTLAEQGLVGFAALVVFAVVALRETFRACGRSWLARAAFIATLSLFLHQIVDDLFFFPKVAELWWLLMGATAVHVWQTQSVTEASGKKWAGQHLEHSYSGVAKLVTTHTGSGPAA
ncbi:MAG: O-antigen ligase family protein [Candidatus Eremiobacteraeota bacterium]|nr:O-antigen ligase family protein [Candidatus Eremiobacteraeota bacterium]